MKKIIFCLLACYGSFLSAAVVNVSPGIDTLVTAVNNAMPGDVLLLQSGPGGEYELSQVVIIDKPLTILGDALNPQQAHVFSTATNFTIFSLLSDDIVLHDFRLEDQGDNGANISTGPQVPPVLGFSGNEISLLNIQYKHRGVSLYATGVVISDNFFETLAPDSEDHIAIFLGGLFGNTEVSDNTFTVNSSGSTGTTFLRTVDDSMSSFLGNFIVENNLLIPGMTTERQTLDYFFYMEGFAFTGSSTLDMTLSGNEFAANNGSFYFYSNEDFPADTFNSVTVEGNIDNSVLPNDYKGLIAFSGSGSFWQVGDTPESTFSFNGNTLATTSITATDWEAAFFPNGLFGINTNVYVVPVVPPVEDLQGSQYVERFASQGDLVNLLTWFNGDINTENFNIYKNSTTNLIATIPARPGRNQYADHGQRPGISTTYYISAIVGVVESSQVSITIP